MVANMGMPNSVNGTTGTSSASAASGQSRSSAASQGPSVFPSQTTPTTSPATNRAQTIVLNIQKTKLANAQAQYDQQEQKAGWLAKASDGIASFFWNSKNTSASAGADLKTTEQNIKTMEDARRLGSENAFNKAFKAEYGVEFNADNINAYAQNPTDANYAKAFGTKDIEKRIDTFCTQQDKGAGNVKTVVVVGASAAATAVTVATAGAAAPLAAASVSSVVGGLVVGGATGAGIDLATDMSNRLSNKTTDDDKLTAQDAYNFAWNTATGALAGGTGLSANGVVANTIKGGTEAVLGGEIAAKTTAGVELATAGVGKAVDAAGAYAENVRLASERGNSSHLLSEANVNPQPKA